MKRTKPKPHYTLAKLLARCDWKAPMSAEEIEWLEAPLVGRELEAWGLVEGEPHVDSVRTRKNPR